MGFTLTSPLLVPGLVFGVAVWRRARHASALDEGLEVDGWVTDLVPITEQAVVVGENHHVIAMALGSISCAWLVSWMWLNR